MSDQIRMTPDMMRTRASEYSTQADMVGEVISKMDSLLDALQSEWEGSSSRSYAEKYNELKPGFVRAQELIMEISQALTKSADLVERTDADIAAQFRA
ncbi:MAG: WXG100 family type VII secretion target [Ruminococcus sp.]|nr:WXG100 family type VII secretion target [Ruminococcus sp.]